MEIINDIVKSDSIEFEGDLGENITDWKIRAEIYCSSKSVKKATANVSGGSDTQILITDAINGKFSIYINAGETIDFNRESNIEIEVEDVNGKRWTVKQAKIEFLPEKIKWDII